MEDDDEEDHTLYNTLSYPLRYTFIHFHTLYDALSYTLQYIFINFTIHFHTLSYTFIHFHTLSYTLHVKCMKVYHIVYERVL